MVGEFLEVEGPLVEEGVAPLLGLRGPVGEPCRLSGEELLAELADAFKFNTFTMDEAFALLSNFNIGDNMTIFLIITIIISADFLSIAWLGYYRGRRYRMRMRSLTLLGHSAECRGFRRPRSGRPSWSSQSRVDVRRRSLVVCVQGGRISWALLLGFDSVDG